MKIGIVTTWFERGAAYVSKQYMKTLQKKHDVFVYARAGENYEIGNPEWDLPNVYWSSKINSPFATTVINKKEFIGWIKKNQIETIIFNEQHWWKPLIWCKDLNIKTLAYIDYYTEQTIPLFGIYDYLLCNTKKHLSAFDWHPGARYLPWGTDLSIFKPKKKESNKVVFFHSCGYAPMRKGTDLLIKSLTKINRADFELIIHTQVNLQKTFPELENIINKYLSNGILKIIHETVPAPGLYFLGDIYVYPSRLDGIGLTIAEAIASGLCVIVPNCGPMNEFVHPDIGKTVNIEKYFSRKDGYYWPQNEVNIDNLALNMEFYLDNKTNVSLMKLKAREYAEENLDWNKNADFLLDIINENSQYENKIKDYAIIEINKFENFGIRKYNKYFIKNKRLFCAIKSIMK